jgi:hypothetical protein
VGLHQARVRLELDELPTGRRKLLERGVNHGSKLGEC